MCGLGLSGRRAAFHSSSSTQLTPVYEDTGFDVRYKVGRTLVIDYLGANSCLAVHSHDYARSSTIPSPLDYPSETDTIADHVTTVGTRSSAGAGMSVSKALCGACYISNSFFLQGRCALGYRMVDGV